MLPVYKHCFLFSLLTLVFNACSTSLQNSLAVGPAGLPLQSELMEVVPVCSAPGLQAVPPQALPSLNAARQRACMRLFMRVCMRFDTELTLVYSLISLCN